MKETLTITSLLAERKKIREKINNIVNDEEFTPVSFYLSSSPFIGARTDVEQEKKIKSDMQSIDSLMTRWNAINKARIKANATTKITVKEFMAPLKYFNGEEPKDEEITIAEAIQRKKWYKEDIIPFLNSIYSKYKKQISFEKTKLENKFDQLVDDEISQRFPADVNKNFSQETITKVRNELAVKYEVKRLDPFDLIKSDKLESFIKLIEDYLSTIDTALSIANAKTEVEFEY